jgi:hypothetical protein
MTLLFPYLMRQTHKRPSSSTRVQPSAGSRNAVEWPHLSTSVWNTPINDQAVYYDEGNANNFTAGTAGPMGAGDGDFMHNGIDAENVWWFVEDTNNLYDMHGLDTSLVYSKSYNERCSGIYEVHTAVNQWGIAPGWRMWELRHFTRASNNTAIFIYNDAGDYVDVFKPLAMCDGSPDFLTVADPFRYQGAQSKSWVKTNFSRNLYAAVGDGTGNGGHGASKLPHGAGCLMPWELKPEAHPVVNGIQTGPRHRLKINWCKHMLHVSNTNIPVGGGDGYRWPATARDGGAWDYNNEDGVRRYNSSHIPARMGALRAIRRTVDLAALQATLTTTPAKMVAWTLYHFGCHNPEDYAALYKVWNKAGFGTASGPEIGAFHDEFYNTWGFDFTVTNSEMNSIGSLPQAQQDWIADLRKIFRELWIVDDCLEATPGGAGSPMTEGPPPFDAATIADATLRSQLLASGEAV